MTVRQPFDQRRWLAAHDSRIKKHPKDLDQVGPSPAMVDTLVELAATIVGFVGVILLIFAGLKIFGYN